MDGELAEKWFRELETVGDKLLILQAEGEGFEPSNPFGLPVFKTGAFNRSATPPEAAT